jgi:hypothetical protein
MFVKNPKIERKSSSISVANVFNIFDDTRRASSVRLSNAMSGAGQRLIIWLWQQGNGTDCNFDKQDLSFTRLARRDLDIEGHNQARGQRRGCTGTIWKRAVPKRLFPVSPMWGSP